MNEFSLTCFYDALTAARAIVSFCAGNTFGDYQKDDMLASAVERKFEIIGEALVRIRRKHPDDLSLLSDTAAIIGFRNILAHTYDHVEETVIWGIISEKIPGFIHELEQIEGIEA
ncbi:MAG: DUF86 domain-containing protein [Armatimonadetes bacterium]|nr:DUF86 domain-containing protein [Akkermansiaceae bacterium]